MNRPAKITSPPQLALQSYLDSLLMEATEELPAEIEALPEVVEVEAALDEFQAAVLEERALDAQQSVVVTAPIMIEAAPTPVPASVSTLASVPQTLVAPVVDVHQPRGATPPAVGPDGRPSWAAEPFECLLFDVAGLTLAVPLVCLGSIYSLAGHELTPLFGQPDWFLGILPSQAGNLKVLDTARWVMPDRYRDDLRQGLQYVISVQGHEWGLAVHQVSRSLRLDPNEIKWRSHRGQRPWLAGTVIEHMCALLDVTELAELIASGGAKHMGGSKAGP
jgi:purine-binding chemotaxis protein CheW